MKKIIFVGETGSGKTTLSQWLQQKERVYHKTQQVYYFDDSIDTPGEFMENRFYYNALVSASVDAQIVAFVQNIQGTQNYFPPFFSARFTKPTIGIITKIDLIKDDQALVIARKRLELAGAKKIFEVSLINGEGMDELEKFLFDYKLE
ncbi:EutP/PduV family microcompartment system protein [Enterococcus sp. AZ109]|uniref:EutP/PduV family microcompartment system protein n=1 Tax=Enterococcus sp. AZ109 TaxID=2774634 RepID=UPI003F1EFBA3